MRLSIGVLTLMAMVACGDKGGDADDSGVVGDDDDAGIADIQVSFDPVVRTTAHVSFTSAEAGTAFVEFGLQGEGFTRTTTEAPSGTSHALPVVLLKAARTYELRPVVMTAGGDRLEGAVQTVTVDPPPQDMIRLAVESVDPSSEVAKGYMATSTLGTGPSYVGVLDGDLDWVFWAEMAPSENAGRVLASARARFSKDGSSVLWNLYESEREFDEGWIVRRPLDGSPEVWTRTLAAHHDFVELPDQSYGWLTYERRDIEVLGTPQSSEIPKTGPYPVATDGLMEVAEGGTEGQESYLMNLYDDFDLEPFWVCSDMEKFGSFLPDYYEWTHSNSLAYTDEEDAYYIGARYLDTIVKVDGATGEVLWELGGLGNDFTWVGDDTIPFEHSHFSQVWPGGFIIFDNRDHDDSPDATSRVAEYHWDETNMTIEQVWSMPFPEVGTKLKILGDAAVLPGGNRMVVWSQRGFMVEVAPDGTEVFNGGIDGIGGIMTRMDWIPAEKVPF